MKTTYEFNAVGTCPVDGSQDIYDVLIEVHDRVVPVEEILDVAATVTSEARYQEDITRDISHNLGGVRVVTTGTHSGILTVCEVCE